MKQKKAIEHVMDGTLKYLEFYDVAKQEFIKRFHVRKDNPYNDLGFMKVEEDKTWYEIPDNIPVDTSFYLSPGLPWRNPNDYDTSMVDRVPKFVLKKTTYSKDDTIKYVAVSYNLIMRNAANQDIGYHCWLSDKKLALFIVAGAGNYLKLVNVEDQSSIQLQSGIGRSLARMSDGKLAFVQKATPQTWYIKSMDANSYNTDIIIETLPGSEDFAFLSDGTFIMGNGSKLYSYKIGNPVKQWTEIADLSKHGVTNIKRLTVSRDQDKIAIVNDVVYRRWLLFIS